MPAQGHRGREVLRHAVRVAGRSLLNGIIFSSGRRQPVVRPRPISRNEADMIWTKMPAVHRVGQLAGAVGELALDPFPERGVSARCSRLRSTSGRSPARAGGGRSSSVTGGAVLELFDLPVLDPLPAVRELFGLVFRLPVQVIDLFGRAEEASGCRWQLRQKVMLRGCAWRTSSSG